MTGVSIAAGVGSSDFECAGTYRSWGKYSLSSYSVGAWWKLVGRTGAQVNSSLPRSDSGFEVLVVEVKDWSKLEDSFSSSTLGRAATDLLVVIGNASVALPRCGEVEAREEEDPERRERLEKVVEIGEESDVAELPED